MWIQMCRKIKTPVLLCAAVSNKDFSSLYSIYNTNIFKVGQLFSVEVNSAG